MLDTIPIELVMNIARYLDIVSCTMLKCAFRAANDNKIDVCTQLVRSGLEYSSENGKMTVTSFAPIVADICKSLDMHDGDYTVHITTSRFNECKLAIIRKSIVMNNKKLFRHSFIVSKGCGGLYQQLQVICEPHYNNRFRMIKNSNMVGDFDVPMLLLYEGFKVLHKMHPVADPTCVRIEHGVAWKNMPGWFWKVLTCDKYPGMILGRIVVGTVAI